MTPDTGQKFAYIVCFVVISVAVTGYFVGLQSPMNPTTKTTNRPQGFSNDVTVESPQYHGVGPHSDWSTTEHVDSSKLGKTILAARYSEMHDINVKRMASYRTSLAELKTVVDPLAEVIITPQQKAFALATREQNRAFNGAPPTIPHPVDQTSSEACMACHGEGFKSETLRISKMSHQFLENCTQCHVENSPSHMNPVLFRENSFVGLPAPNGGPRAFDSAPPQIPHSTWMRVDCNSCHGFAGPQGIRTTHPWRQNCQQCHAPSSVLDQVQLHSEPDFLPPPEISN